MTIMREALLDIRDEYPDLDLEVRSILLARSQEGATIADITDDYRKNVGQFFPIYQNITEFLLSIPYVTALCDENGKLIFNVLPSPKSKHIYDMVQEQKPQQQMPFQQKHQHMEYQHEKYNECDNIWYSNNNNKQVNHQYNYDYIEKNNKNANNNNNINGVPININVIEAKTQPPTNKIDVPIITNEEKIVAAKFTEELSSNNYYQDNCNHLLNRLYYQRNVTPQTPVHNNFTNKNQIKSNNRLTQYHHIETKLVSQPRTQLRTIQQENYLNLNKNEKQLNAFKQPMMRSIYPNASRATSPSITRSSRYNDSIYTTDSDYEAHLLDFPLLGDDFFLFLARMELRCKFKKYDKVLQSGLCISGQSIRAAVRRVRQLDDQSKSIIVNIGSVDIMKGRPLVQIEHDFRELLNLMFKKGYTPILTTLAPLANYAHDKQIKAKLYRFNEFIKKEGRFLIVMDLWSCLVNERGQIRFDCFQNEPRMVTGASEPYVFWNKIGRQRVLQLIESQLEY